MFEYIRGEITQLTPTYLVIEAGGIGYYLHISLNTYSVLQNIENSKDAKIFTHSVIKEDAHLLFGFHEETERKLFRQLIIVSGIGANTGRMMLSSMNPGELITVIAQGDVEALKSIKGIGLKTAQRIIIELKDKVGSSSAQQELFTSSNNTVRDEALSALIMLGFQKKAVDNIVSKEIQKKSEISVEELIKNALKQL